MIKQQLDTLIREVRKLNTRDDDLWTKQEIANYLRCGLSTVDKLIARDDFPASVKAPTGKNGSRPRWVAGEVKRYILKHREAKP